MTEGSKVTSLIVRTADVCNTMSNGMRLTRAANALKKKKESECDASERKVSMNSTLPKVHMWLGLGRFDG